MDTPYRTKKGVCLHHETNGAAICCVLCASRQLTAGRGKELSAVDRVLLDMLGEVSGVPCASGV